MHSAPRRMARLHETLHPPLCVTLDTVVVYARRVPSRRDATVISRLARWLGARSSSMSLLESTFSPPDVQEMVATRRDLHAHPELAFEEVRTAGIVAERLKGLGLEPRTGVGKTGVLATVRGGRSGKTVLLRADMDALPILEENEVPYRSQNAGKMHACGHDCHTSILLGVAKQLVERAGTLPGRAKLCFQP